MNYFHSDSIEKIEIEKGKIKIREREMSPEKKTQKFHVIYSNSRNIKSDIIRKQ